MGIPTSKHRLLIFNFIVCPAEGDEQRIHVFFPSFVEFKWRNFNLMIYVLNKKCKAADCVSVCRTHTRNCLGCSEPNTGDLILEFWYFHQMQKKVEQQSQEMLSLQGDRSKLQREASQKEEQLTKIKNNLAESQKVRYKVFFFSGVII